MIIGMLKVTEGGYAGRIATLSLGVRGIALIPAADAEDDFDVTLEDTPYVCGRAKHEGKDILVVEMDCPGLPGRLEAWMELKASAEGYCTLQWKRPNP
jgi:uncharacterized protein (DUF736 family)